MSLKITQRSTFRHKLVRYPDYLRIQFQRRCLALLRFGRSLRNRSDRSSRGKVTQSVHETSQSVSPSRRPAFVSQLSNRFSKLRFPSFSRGKTREQKAWTFAAITGTLAILLLLVLQIVSAKPAKTAHVEREPARWDQIQIQTEPLEEESTQRLPAADLTLPADEFNPLEAADHAAEAIQTAAAEEPFSPFEETDPRPPTENKLQSEPNWNFDLEAVPAEETVPDVELEVEVVRTKDDAREMESLESHEERFHVTSDDRPNLGEPQPVPFIDVGTPRDEWRAAEPSQPVELTNPTLFRERLPTWRIVAPVARSQRPTEILATESGPKDLNITVEKTTPPTSRLHEILSYEILVRNNSTDSIDGLIIDERIPPTWQVADVSPQATFEQGALRWFLPQLEAGEERKLQVNLIATQDGTAESLTTVQPIAAVSAETVVSPPALQLEVTAQPEIAVGRECPLLFRVTNTGSMPLKGLVLRTSLAEHLQHTKGESLDLEIGQLAAGETRTAHLHPRATRVGTAVTRAAILIAGQPIKSAEQSVRIIAASQNRVDCGCGKCGTANCNCNHPSSSR